MLKNSSSFRDPSGYIFEHQSNIYRSVNRSYSKDFEVLTNSGLMDTLSKKELLVSHEIVDLPEFNHHDLLLILKPEKLPLISYPYEWSFTQLKEAALHTLAVLKVSLEHGMILKDASGFNIQFKSNKPVFIDTLSFTIYQEGQVWNGYRQFCEHFLSPLCISSYLGVAFQSLLRLGVDGIPLKMASQLLPWHTWLKPSPLMHIHLHAKTVGHYEMKKKSHSSKENKISKRNLFAMIDHLQTFISQLQLGKSDKTQWEDYDKETHYSENGKKDKVSILQRFVNQVNPKVVWDIGANDGFFSRAITGFGRQILSLDADPLAIEKNSNYAKSLRSENIYPLLFDLVNPTPNLGWANQERLMLSQRSKPDLIVALALIHHIVITYNIPFDNIANYFAGLSEWLIIEFVPEEDEKINALPETAGKKNYSLEKFENAFLSRFETISEDKIVESERILFLFKRK